jgi:hypothetical protein
MTELPFKLHPNHKKWTKDNWRYHSKMNFTDEDFELFIYPKYIYATNCELCNKKFKNTKDRQLDHNHETGEIRNIVCNSCNQRKYDKKILSTNKSGYTGIYKKLSKTTKQGFIWNFETRIEGKPKLIKCSIDFDWLVKFADNWKKENNYYS